MKSLRIYSFYFTQFLKRRLAYRMDFLLGMLSSVFSAVSGLIFILLLIDGHTIPQLQGWSRDEVLFIYAFSMLSTSLFLILAPNLFRFGDRYIIQGEFDRVLLRPLNSLAQVIFESFNLDSLGSTFLGGGLLFYAARRLSLSFGFFEFFWLIVGACSGAVILLAVFVSLASVSFHFEDRIGISPPFWNLIMFGRYPTPIYDRFLQILLRWVIPFAFIAFYPATFFLRPNDYTLYCFLTPLVALFFSFIALASWNFGVSRYTSTGN